MIENYVQSNLIKIYISYMSIFVYFGRKKKSFLTKCNQLLLLIISTATYLPNNSLLLYKKKNYYFLYNIESFYISYELPNQPNYDINYYYVVENTKAFHTKKCFFLPVFFLLIIIQKYFPVPSYKGGSDFWIKLIF